MRALIVCCHPQTGSLSHQFAKIAAETLSASGHQVETLDLYAQNYRPALNAAERAAYYGDTALLQTPETEQLCRAEILVLAFPTWWFSPPAMLKGWIDRTFAPDAAFANTPDFGPIKPLLTSLKHVVVATTLGSPWWVDRLVMRRPVRNVLKNALFRACAPKARFHYLPFYSAENPSAERVADAQRKLSAALDKLAT